MLEPKALISCALLALGAGLTGCGSISRGLGNFTSSGLVDEYSIPQNQSLAMPTDFSRLPTPKNKVRAANAVPSAAEIEALMFTLEPEEVPEYTPITVVHGEVPTYEPIGQIVASGSNGAAASAMISTSTTPAGSIFPVYTSATDSQTMAVSTELAPAGSASSDAVSNGMMVLSAEDVAALSALAVGGPVATAPAAAFDAQPVTSLPAGVTVVGSPVVLPR